MLLLTGLIGENSGQSSWQEFKKCRRYYVLQNKIIASVTLFFGLSYVIVHRIFKASENATILKLWNNPDCFHCINVINNIIINHIYTVPYTKALEAHIYHVSAV